MAKNGSGLKDMRKKCSAVGFWKKYHLWYLVATYMGKKHYKLLFLSLKIYGDNDNDIQFSQK